MECFISFADVSGPGGAAAGAAGPFITPLYFADTDSAAVMSEFVLYASQR